MRLMSVCALVTILLLSGISALADETRISQLQTALSNTSISGGVITAATFTIQPSPQTPHVFRHAVVCLLHGVAVTMDFPSDSLLSRSIVVGLFFPALPVMEF